MNSFKASEDQRMNALRVLLGAMFYIIAACDNQPSVPPYPPFYSRPIVMKEISAGTFLMGADDRSASSDEYPVHYVKLSAFSMQETEVTQGQFSVLMATNPSRFADKADNPVEEITWYDAVLYCNKLSKKENLDTVYHYTTMTGTPGNGCTLLDSLQIDYSKKGYRLPTEAEWEYACRGGTTTLYWWGNDPAGKDSTTWCYGNSQWTTHPVAQKSANGYGLYDMTGNVWEFCNDWYAPYDSAAQTNPTGPDSTTGKRRVIRGGSWYGGNDDELRSSFRNTTAPGWSSNDNTGFRCVLPY